MAPFELPADGECDKAQGNGGDDLQIGQALFAHQLEHIGPDNQTGHQIAGHIGQFDPLGDARHQQAHNHGR